MPQSSGWNRRACAGGPGTAVAGGRSHGCTGSDEDGNHRYRAGGGKTESGQRGAGRLGESKPSAGRIRLTGAAERAWEACAGGARTKALSGSYYYAAIDGNHGAVNEACLVRSEPKVCIGHV